MTNAERIAADVGFIIGQYERREITAQAAVFKIAEFVTGYEVYAIGCKHCVFRDCQCVTDDDELVCRCEDGIKAWFKKEAEP